MDFLKKHYEKVLLGIVLLGLVVGAVFLILMVPSERAELEQKSQEIINRPVKPLEDLDLAKPETLLKEMQSVVTLDFSSTNKLFNPVPWQKKPDGMLVKAVKGNVGVEAVVVTEITPLHLILSLDSATETDSGARYTIGVVREAETNPARRRKKQYYATLNNKNDVFLIREVHGPPGNPIELIVELNDTGEQVTLRKNSPFKRVDGYMADLKYEPEKKVWKDRRVGMSVAFDNEEYNIVAINSDEVVLSAKSNNKKTSIPYKSGS